MSSPTPREGLSKVGLALQGLLDILKENWGKALPILWPFSEAWDSTLHL